jgi:membrane protease YdiL (CAAX protease family)
MTHPRRLASAGVVTSAYIAAIAVASAVSVFWSIFWGVIANLVLILLMLNHYLVVTQSYTPRRTLGCDDGTGRRALVVLTLIPVAAVVTATAPVTGAADVNQYVAIGAPMFLATIGAIRFTGLGVTMTTQRNWQQLVVAATGIPLSILGFLVVEPLPVVGLHHSRTLVREAVILVVFTAILEEGLFRGVIQSALRRIFSRTAPLWSTALYGIAYIGVRPVSYLVFAVIIALTFAVLVEHTRALAGAVVSHAIVNIGLILVWPTVLR